MLWLGFTICYCAVCAFVLIHDRRAPKEVEPTAIDICFVISAKFARIAMCFAAGAMAIYVVTHQVAPTFAMRNSIVWLIAFSFAFAIWSAQIQHERIDAAEAQRDVSDQASGSI